MTADTHAFPHAFPFPLHSPELGEWAKAFAAAQIKFKDVHKNADNPFYKSTFADSAEVRRATVEALSECGLVLTQGPFEWDGKPHLLTELIHESGQFKRSFIHLKAPKADHQSTGGVMTFWRRHCAMAMLNLAPQEDDDGEGAMGRETSPAPARQSAPRQGPPQVSAPAPSPYDNLKGALNRTVVDFLSYDPKITDVLSNLLKETGDATKPEDVPVPKIDAVIKEVRALYTAMKTAVLADIDAHEKDLSTSDAQDFRAITMETTKLEEASTQSLVKYWKYLTSLTQAPAEAA